MGNFLHETESPIFGGFPFYTDEEGYLTWRSPRWGGNDGIPFIAIGDDYGDLVHGVFLDPKSYNRKLIHGISQSATPSQLVETFEKGRPRHHLSVFRI